LKSKLRAYDSVSLIYDDLMIEIDYERWSDYILNIRKIYLEKADINVLELSAGNCKMAGNISKSNPRYIASDSSLPMLRKAKNFDNNKICCDMTTLPFRTKFDFIFSTFDSVNYLLSERLLLNLFREVKNILSDSGIFTFDTTLEKNSLEFEKSYVNEGEYHGFQYKRKSKYFPNTRIHKNIFEIRNRFGTVLTEVHKQKIYKFETYFKLIKKAGLYVVECLDTFTFDTGNSNSERIQFILKIDKSDAKF
jgi:Methyltransferase domain